MSKFEITIQKGLMYTFGAIGIVAFGGAAFFGAYWQIGTGLACVLIYLAMRYELKKEA